MYANHGLFSIQALLSLRLCLIRRSTLNSPYGHIIYYIPHPPAFYHVNFFLLCVPLQPFLTVHYYIGQ